MPSISASRPFTTVTIDKPREVRYSWASATRFEDAFGKTIVDALVATIGVKLITTLAWAGMLDKEPVLTIKETERRIQTFLNLDGDINKLAEELLNALASSGVIGKAKTEPKEDEQPAADSGNEPAVTVEPLE